MKNKQNLLNRIYLSPPHLSGKEYEYVQDALQSNWIAPVGPYIDKFEELICEHTGAKHCVVLNSGTSALHIALLVLGIKKDDIVIISSFTFPASANPILYSRAIPVFVDIEDKTWNIDPEILNNAILDCIQKGKPPKAIILPHIYGMPAKVQEIISIAKKYDIPVIEDAAEALGSTYHQKQLGTFGTLGVLSFNGNKIITTSGGGAIISDDATLIEQAKFLSTQARDISAFYEHSQLGFNYRLSNICAAIGCAQITVLQNRINKRRSNFTYYKKHLEVIPFVSFLDEPEGHFSNRWLTTILIDEEKASISCEHIREQLESLNIETRPLWKPLHLQPLFKEFASYKNGKSEKLYKQGLCLPSGSSLSEENLALITSGLIKILTLQPIF